MKKIVLLLAITIFTLTMAPGLVLAQGSDSVEESIRNNLEPIQDVYNPVEDPRPGSLQITIARVIRQLLAFLGIVFILLILWGGWKWMTAAGNESQLSDAKSIITSAIVGLAIILVAYGVAQFITNQLLEATGAR